MHVSELSGFEIQFKSLKIALKIKLFLMLITKNKAIILITNPEAPSPQIHNNGKSQVPL